MVTTAGSTRATSAVKSGSTCAGAAGAMAAGGVAASVAAETAWKVPFQYQYHLKEITYLRPSPEEAKIPFSPQLAVDYMEQGALAWSAERSILS